MKIKESRDPKHLQIMLDALIWNYKGEDLDYLAQYDVLNVLQNGDGGQMHPLRLAWGRQIKQKLQKDDNTLTRTVINLFEFLFKQILSQITQIDAQKAEDSGDQSK